MNTKISNKMNQYIDVKKVIIFYILSIFIFAFIIDTPSNIIQGMIKIVNSTDVLLSDYFVIGGIGATFFNAALLMSIALSITLINKIKLTGSSIASILLFGGFSMFGKNILNIWPIIFGVFLFSKLNKKPFSQYNMIALYGASLAPLVTEFINLANKNILLIIIFYILSSFIGFILPPICLYSVKVHQGYNLYNVGFSCGIIGSIIISLLKSLDINIKINILWSTHYYLSCIIFLYFIFFITFICGFIMNNYSFKNYKHFTSHSGRLIADFVIMEGLPLTLINMGILGIFYLTILNIIKAPLNGPTIGGLLSIVAFAAFGKHIKNTFFILIGVFIIAIFRQNFSDPNLILSLLFSTCLAPIAGHFGGLYGIIAGMLHTSLVARIGILHSGVNLYNNGFSAGIICILLVPLFEAFKNWRENE